MSLQKVGFSCFFTSLAVLACDSSYNSQITPTTPIPNFPTIQDDAQSESVIVETETSNGKNALLVAFNDETIEANLKFKEWQLLNGKSVKGRGYSFMGRSISFDGGKSWKYLGKIRPSEGSGISAIIGDPSLAVDPNNKKIVYYAQMAVSDQSWSFSESNGSEDFKAGPLFQDSICIAKSLDGGETFKQMECASIGAFTPKKEAVDRTAIAVDKKGCLWLSYFDMSNESPLLFYSAVTNNVGGGCGGESNWFPIKEILPDTSKTPTTCDEANGIVGCCDDKNNLFRCDEFGNIVITPCSEEEKYCGWSKLTSSYQCVSKLIANADGPDLSHQQNRTCGGGPDVSVYYRDQHPKLVNDSEGNIWFGTYRLIADVLDPTKSLVSETKVRKFNADVSQWTHGLVANPFCSMPSLTLATFQTHGFVANKAIKVANPYDFAAGEDESGRKVVRIANQVPTWPQKSLINVVEVGEDSSCITPLGWTMLMINFDVSQKTAFQPVVSVSRTTPALWMLGFLSDVSSPDSTIPFVSAMGWPLQSYSGGNLGEAVESLNGYFRFSPITSKPCTNIYSDGSNYWGDYWGIAATKEIVDGKTNVFFVGAYTSSLVGNGTCKKETEFEVNPMHIKTARVYPMQQ